MLILERKVDEGLLIDLDGIEIEVKVLRVRGNRVKIGILGRSDVTVERTDEYGEVVPREKKEKAG